MIPVGTEYSGHSEWISKKKEWMQCGYNLSEPLNYVGRNSPSKESQS